MGKSYHTSYGNLEMTDGGQRMSELSAARELEQKLTALEQLAGRILMRGRFGKSWDAMTLMEKMQVVAYCEQIVGQPHSLSLCQLRPNIGLEISALKVWAVAIDCDSELTAYRIGKWAASVSALVTILHDANNGYRVRCLGLNPLAWRDALHRYAS